MRENGNRVLRRYLEEIISAKRTFEAQLREFAGVEKDDEDVRRLFVTLADAVHDQVQRLAQRLESIGGSTGHAKSSLASLFHLISPLPHVIHAPEERSLRNLITSYMAGTGELAFYEAVANIARAAGDNDSEALARQIQNEQRIAAEKIWHLLPSRSKIAFNMLTVSEVDPAVETKMADDRLGS